MFGTIWNNFKMLKYVLLVNCSVPHKVVFFNLTIVILKYTTMFATVYQFSIVNCKGCHIECINKVF